MVQELLGADFWPIYCFGMGGVILAGFGWFGKDWKITSAIAVLVLVCLLGLAIRGEPAGLLLPPAILAGYVLLCRISRSTLFDRLSPILASPFRSRRGQALFLLIAGPALAIGWGIRTHWLADLGAQPIFAYQPAAWPALKPAGELYTDRGRALTVYRKPAPDEDLKLRENQAERAYPARAIKTAQADSLCNCHGWVFARGAYWMAAPAVEAILRDHEYVQVEEPVVGDLVVYRDQEGTICHSGVVRAAPRGGPILVESRWNEIGRYIHRPAENPYSGQYAFYRTKRPDHALGMPPG